MRQTAVDKIVLHGYTTYTARAMQKAARDYQNSSRWGDEKVTKVMILLTDGKYVLYRCKILVK